MKCAFAALAVLMACSQTPADSQTGSKPTTPDVTQSQPGTEKARQQTPEAKPQPAAKPTASQAQQPAANSTDAQSQPPTQTPPANRKESRVYLYQHAQYGWVYHYPDNPNKHFYDPRVVNYTSISNYQPTINNYQPTYYPPINYQPASFASPGFGGFGGGYCRT